MQAIRKNLEKVTEGHATVVRGHAIVGWLSNNVFFDVSSNTEKFWNKSLKVTRQWSEVTRPLDDCQTTFFRRCKQFGKFLKKVTDGHATLVGGHVTVVWLSNNVFFYVSSNSKNIWKKSLNGFATVVGGHATIGRLSKQRFFDVSSNSEKFWKKSLKVTRQWSEVTRPLDDCQTTFFRRFKQFGKILKKSLKVTRQWSEVTRPLDDCQTTFFRRCKQFGKILKKVTEGHATVVGGHATVGWLSNNVFLIVPSNSEKFWKKSLKVTWEWSEVTRLLDDCQTTFLRRCKQFGKILKKVTEGHATVVRGHATVVWLSNNVFLTFQAIRKTFEKSLWTVTRQWSEVTRPLDDCQTTFFRRFKQFGRILKKSLRVTRQWSEVTRLLDDCQTTFFRRCKQFGKKIEKSHWRSRDSGRRSRDRWMTVKQRFLTVSSISEKFWKKSLKVTRQWSEVTRLLDDCQTTFFLTLQAIRKNFEKSHSGSRDSGRRSRDRWMTVKQRFFNRFKQFGKILKKVTEGHATVVGGHATVVWLSNKKFLTFQAIRKIFEKSHWRSRGSGRRSRDRWMTVKQRFKTFRAIRKNFEKSHWRSRESGRRSRDRCMTVKQGIFDVSSNSENFRKKTLKVTRQWSEVTRPLDDCQTTFFRRCKQFGKILKKVTEGHATVVGGHATVVWLSNNVFLTFQAIRKTFEKSLWTVTRQWSEVTRPLADCQTTFSRRFKQFAEFF